jgi:enterochelin esterase-like enzyme
MPTTNDVAGIRMENTLIRSRFLQREVVIDFYLPPSEEIRGSHPSLLLINDGQDLPKMPFSRIMEKLYAANNLHPLLCCGIHASKERRLEYGTQHFPDYKERGIKAPLYTSFILEELLPFIESRYAGFQCKEKAFAGFSLGGLSALDIVWNRPDIFSKAGVFSGSLWWRSLDQHHPDYDDHRHRIMHRQIRNGRYAPGLQFFFQCGNLDETKDRNKNGIIDSIDDTLDLIKELEAKGYKSGADINYLEFPDGYHDISTWGRAMPEFLKWGWKK